MTESPSHISQHFLEVLGLQMPGLSNVRVLVSGQASRVLGEYAPMRMHGSFLITAGKW
jgi:hypothetical protein